METCVRNYYYEEALELRKKSCETNGKEASIICSNFTGEKFAVNN